MRQSSHTIDEIRSRLDIVQWIAQHVSLKKAGRTYKGLCPFHSEKTPSFTVNPEKQIFHCFGCGVGGDILSFTMKFRNVPFKDALKLCADAAGVVLPEVTKKSTQASQVEDRERRYLLRVNQLACEFFHHTLKTLPPSHPLLPYLKKRQLDLQTITHFRLGYAPDGWHGLLDFLKSRRVPLSLIEKTGLIRAKDGRHYDFFRNRLIFPIISLQGEILGFGGRQLSDDSGPKYLNSPDSPVYHKGRTLYGLHWSKPLMEAQRRAFIVEGYIDCLRMIQSGFPAVAPLGTALTESHLSLLARHGYALFLLFDGDAAGFRALLKSMDLCIEKGLSASVIVLPKEDDPDSFILKNGAPAMEALINTAPSGLDFLLDWLRQNPLAPDVQADAIGLFLKLQNPIEKIRYLEKIAAFFNLSVTDLKKGFFEKKIRTTLQVSSDNRETQPATPWETQLITGLLNRPHLSDADLSALSALIEEDFEHNTCFSDVGRQVTRHIAGFCTEHHRPPELHDLLSDFNDEAISLWLMSLCKANSADSSTQPESEINLDALLKKITFLHIKNKLKSLTLSIEQAERHKNIEEMAMLLEKKMRLLKHLQHEKWSGSGVLS